MGVRSVFLLFFLFALISTAQEAPKEKGPIIVTASPLKPEDVFLTPYNADVVTEDQIQLKRLSRSTPEILKEIPGVSVQKTAHGHGSPYIRGLTGYRNLLLIDGIRLNNSIFRAGPNQYWNTIDQYLIDSIEVIMGPSSVLYGSDAIGGTVAVYTREPDSFESGFHIHEQTFLRLASAEDSLTTRQEFLGNIDDIGFLGGITYKDFGDITGGKHTGPQPKTGYDEYSADIKLVDQLSKDARLIFAYKHNQQDDVPRTHQTQYYVSWQGTSTRTDRVHEFDQERDLAYLQYRLKNVKLFFDEFNASLSFQHNGEGFRRVQSSGAQELRDMSVNSIGTWFNMGSTTNFGYLSYGAEFYRDFVESSGKDISSSGRETRYDRGDVGDDATYDLLGVFIQDEVEIIKKLTITPGIRLSWISYDSDQNSFPTGPASGLGALDDDFSAVVGSLRGVYQLDPYWVILGGVSQGFRAPSLHDITAFRIKGPGTDLPSPGIDPEKAIQYELGSRARYDRWQAGLFFFFTDLEDLIDRIQVSTSPVQYRLENFGDGEIWGIESYLQVKLTNDFLAYADLAYAIGNRDTIVGSVTTTMPLDKVNPTLAHLGLRWQPEKTPYWAEVFSTVARNQDRHSLADLTDNRIPPNRNEGTPGYATVGLRSGYELSKNLTVSLSIENITNKDYRAHGSGQNEPGTNIIAGLKLSF